MRFNSLPTYALAFLAGNLLLQIQAALPSFYYLLFYLPLIIFWLKSGKPALLVVLVFLSGFSWAHLSAANYLIGKVNAQLAESVVVVEGVVEDIPVISGAVTRFKLRLNKFQAETYNGPEPRLIRLNWYYAKVTLKPGQIWQLRVKLKPPNGMQNPGGFDYEAWLYQQGIQASGYVKKHKHNRLLAEAGWQRLFDQLRLQIKQQIESAVSADKAALLNALAIGYRGSMQPSQWQLFTSTGTNHLIAISGLHIGLVAGFVWFMLRQLGRFYFLTRLINRRVLIITSFTAALCYAGLAGFSIPTQRAIIMLAVVYLGLYLYRQLLISHSLATALIVVLLLSPTATISIGFWLSFLAVASIAYAVVGRHYWQTNKTRLPLYKIKPWLWPQVVVIIALMPVSFYFFQQSSVVALPSNLIAIPFIAILVLPLLLITLIVNVFSVSLASTLYALNAALIDYLLQFLAFISQQSFSIWSLPQPTLLATILASFGLLLVFSPRGLPCRWLGLCFCLPLFINTNTALKTGDIQLRVVDVGQGLSVLVSTTNQHLLFDAGAKYGQGFDVGERVVVPVLRKLDVKSLHTLVLSNGDNDHMGGAGAILQAMPVLQILGRDIESLEQPDKTLCKRGQQWQVDGVLFEILHPQHQQYAKRNNYSCVLRISNKHLSILIAADIEEAAEAELVDFYGDELRSNVLIAPHHGSKTSSTAAFIEAVSPDLVVYSTGYLNRYRFPRPEVEQRYQQRRIQQLSTANSGMISILLAADGKWQTAQRYRLQNRRYWHRLLDDKL